MKYLLDTHVLLWIAYEEHKISSKIKKYYCLKVQLFI